MIGIKYDNKIIILNKYIFIGVYEYDSYNIESLSEIIDFSDIPGDVLLGRVNGSEEEICYKMIVKKYLNSKNK